jgi:hypothetical protein
MGGDKGLKRLSVEFSTGITQVLSEKELKYNPDISEQEESCMQPSEPAYSSGCIYWKWQETDLPQINQSNLSPTPAPLL